MKRIPFFLAIAFILVTLSRVAEILGNNVLAWSMATGLTIGVFVSAYFLDYRRPKSAALASLVFFMLVDLWFNLSDTLRWSVQSGRWYTMLPMNGLDVPIYQLVDPVAGMFPTLSAALMGWLMKRTDQIGLGRKLGFWGTMRQEFLQWLLGEQTHASSELAQSKPELAPISTELAPEQFTCEYCGACASKTGIPFKTKQALNAHYAHCEQRKSKVQ